MLQQVMQCTARSLRQHNPLCLNYSMREQSGPTMILQDHAYSKFTVDSDMELEGTLHTFSELWQIGTCIIINIHVCVCPGPLAVMPPLAAPAPPAARCKCKNNQIKE